MRVSKIISKAGFLHALTALTIPTITAHPAHSGASLKARELVHDPASKFPCNAQQVDELNTAIQQALNILNFLVKNLKIDDPEYKYWMDPDADSSDAEDKKNFARVMLVYGKMYRALTEKKTGFNLEVNCMPESSQWCENVYAYIQPGSTSGLTGDPKLLRSDSLNLCPMFWEPTKMFMIDKPELEFEWAFTDPRMMTLRNPKTKTYYDVCSKEMRNQFGYWSEVVVKPMILIHELSHARVFNDNIEKDKVEKAGTMKRSPPLVTHDCAYGAYFSKWLTTVRTYPDRKISFFNADSYAFLAFGRYMRDVCGGDMFTQDLEVTFVPRWMQPLSASGKLRSKDEEEACNPKGYLGKEWFKLMPQKDKDLIKQAESKTEGGEGTNKNNDILGHDWF